MSIVIIGEGKGGWGEQTCTQRISRAQELYVKVEVAVLGSPSLMVLNTVSADVKPH